MNVYGRNMILDSSIMALVVSGGLYEPSRLICIGGLYDSTQTFGFCETDKRITAFVFLISSHSFCLLRLVTIIRAVQIKLCFSFISLCNAADSFMTPHLTFPLFFSLYNGGKHCIRKLKKCWVTPYLVLLPLPDTLRKHTPCKHVFEHTCGDMCL